jgi:hypothetical protein
VGIVKYLNLFACGKFPDDDILVTASGYNQVFLWAWIELKAEH